LLPLCDENTSKNQSCRLNDEVIKMFIEEFDDMDYDGNQLINQKELGNFMNSLGSEYTDDDQGKEILSRMFHDIAGP